MTTRSAGTPVSEEANQAPLNQAPLIGIPIEPPSSVACVICGGTCPVTTAEGIYCHPLDVPCVAVLVDAKGESLDQQYFIAEDGNIYAFAVPIEEPTVDAGAVVTETPEPERELPILPDAPPLPTRRRKKEAMLPADATVTGDGTILIPTGIDPSIVTMDNGLQFVFDKYKQPRLGGASGDLGWSSFSTYQRCPYLFKRIYIDQVQRDAAASRALEIGSAFHSFAAVYYQQLINPEYPISPQKLYEGLLEAGCNGEFLMESWRVWSGYALEYEQDFIKPLAVEYHVVDEATRESARYDLVAQVEEANGVFSPGTWIIEHKTASRFDDSTVDGWQNDGEIIGQIMLWNRCKLNKKFGKLVGVMVNIVGKQRSQQFHRTAVIAARRQLNQHARDLRSWQGFRQLAMANDLFPRARAACIGRYGKCSQWDHCAERDA